MVPEQEILKETVSALEAEWHLERPEVLTEEAILQLLAQKLTEIIQKGPEAFFQLMYRLDISEKKLNAAIGDTETAQKIARLVYDRQLGKIISRRENKQDKTDWDPELEW
jgi:hypothetical protein